MVNIIDYDYNLLEVNTRIRFKFLFQQIDFLIWRRKHLASLSRWNQKRIY
jgi:hypothetical protein